MVIKGDANLKDVQTYPVPTPVQGLGSKLSFRM